MKVDVSQSIYEETSSAVNEFDRTEIRHLRYLLRRLRYLEQQVRERGGMADDTASGGAAHAEMEIGALEWLLDDVGFLTVRK